MLFCVGVVVDAHEQYVAGILAQLGGIVLALNLVDGGIFFYLL
jgi:hypothetical protein